MTQVEIREKANQLFAAIGEAELRKDDKYRRLRQEWHALKAACSHPDAETKPQDVGQGTYTACPDCRGIIATT